MASVVLELQRDALDRNVPITDLLRKALVVAKKLDVADIQQWITSELNGYGTDGESIPEYRVVSGEVKAWNPYHGWIPVLFQDSTQAKRVMNRKSRQSVAEIETLLENRTKDGQLMMPFPPEVERMLCRDAPFETRVTLFVQFSSLMKICDSVRTTILDWALKLEQAGILGEGLTFSPEDRKQAAAQYPSVLNFYGSVSSPQIQQNVQGSFQVAAPQIDFDKVEQILSALRASHGEVELDQATSAELAAEIQTLEVQLKSPKPKASIVREGLHSIRSILEGAGGGVASHLVIEIGKLLLL